MNVYIVRHGETRLNETRGNLQGRIDEPLNEHGRAQADRLGARFQRQGLSFDRVYASPSDRAVETAVRVSGWRREDVITDQRLFEMGFGPYEGKKYYTMGDEAGKIFLHHPESFIPPKGVESFQHLLERTADFLRELYETEKTGSILVGCHGGTIRGFLHALGRIGLEGFWDYPVDNCAWYRLVRGEKGFVLAEQSE